MFIMSFEYLHKPLDEVREGRRRVSIENVRPEVDGGRFPAKRVVGDEVVVRADAFGDGHDLLAASLRYRRAGEEKWAEIAMDRVGHDQWEGRFAAKELGRYQYTVRAWVDRFGTWRHDMQKRMEAKQKYDVDLLIGAELMRDAAERAQGRDTTTLRNLADFLSDEDKPPEERASRAMESDVSRLMKRWPDDSYSTEYPRVLELVIDPELARFSGWYEFFPRSFGKRMGAHGTLSDAADVMIPYVAEMGFDVVYLPPIHPIGHTHRKGKNNTANAEETDVGSPWAIGAKSGGHKAIHPQLGTMDDFDYFLDKATEHGLAVALDIAFQVSPDHPYADRHPEWFRQRPDGTIQYAENPPKKYQDIYPFDFETDQWRAMWKELESVIRFWCERGVRVFRVDNPHTKAFTFWEWCIASIKRDFPETIFLSEAFTRPSVMYRLAKLGFTQSYTYFTWRTTKHELTQYVQQLTRSDLADYFRPNFWPNTPDILPLHLQVGGRPAFMARFALAATLSSNYGVYGPAFELMEHEPLAPGSEEYLHSEKYEVRAWDLEDPDSLAPFMKRINAIRRENPALHVTNNVHFHPVDNEHLLAYSKHSADRENVVVVVVNLDPNNVQAGDLELDRDFLGLPADEPLHLHDLLGEGQYLWGGRKTRVTLDPEASPVLVLRLEHRPRKEQDYEYFL